MALDMTTALTIRAKVDGTNEINGLNAALGKTSQQASGAATAFDKLRQAGNGLRGALASIGTGALFAGIAKAGIDSDRAAKRIANLAGQFNETAKLTKVASEAAKTYGLGQTQAANSVADLYARLRPTGTSLDQIKTAFIGVNNAAAKMGLTADQTDLVMYQLSQSLGSGKLQGEEFRSVMESLPTIGQAVAEVLKADISELKGLSTAGVITTEVLLQALDKLSKTTPPPPDAYKRYQAALADLSTAIGQQLLPALTPLLELATQALGIFASLPEPVQTLVVAIGGLAAGLVLIAPLLTPIVALFKFLVTLNIGATIAGWAGAIVPLAGALKGLAALIVTVFTGPVGWIALAVAAGVAIYAFRDKIADAFRAIGSVLTAAARFFLETYVKPVLAFYGKIIDGIKSGVNSLASALTAPFKSAIDVVKSIFRSLLEFVANGINNAIKLINGLIGTYNRLPTPDLPTVPTVSVPAFATGGVVNGPTLAMVGERGTEYIVPESKMAGAAANYLNGMRGRNVIPAFAEGGVVNAMGAGGAANTTVQITTGPVLQQDGQRYVTMGDMERALQDFGAQIFRNSRSYGGRRYQGAY